MGHFVMFGNLPSAVKSLPLIVASENLFSAFLANNFHTLIDAPSVFQARA